MLHKYTKKLISILLLVILTTSGFTIPQTANATNNWFNPTWQYRKPITIDNSNNTIPLKNYVLTINLDYTNFDFYKANTSGYDFRFTLNDNKTILDHDIEYYNYPKNARVKVKIPYAPAKLNSQIYLYYGAKTSVSNISVDLSQISDINISDNFQIFNNGQYYGPSNWKIEGSGYNAQVIQTSNIWSYDAPKMSGTYAMLKDSNFTQGDLDLEIMSKDNDGIGIIFGSKDKDNYYRFSWYVQGTKGVPNLPGTMLGSGIFLQKQVNGKWSTLYHNSTTYQQNRWYQIKITLDDENIKISIDGKKYINIKDNSVRGSKVGLYSWANTGSYFRNVIDMRGYENPNLYLPVAYRVGDEQNISGYYQTIDNTTPSTIIRISENNNVIPTKLYNTRWPTPIFSGLAIYGLKVKLFIDDNFITEITPKEGEKSNVANWFYWHKQNIPAGEHTVHTVPYNPKTGQELIASPKIKFIVHGDPEPKIQPMSNPRLVGLGENPKVDMTRVYITHQLQPTITGLSPFGWPVRIYIDNESMGDATVQNGETTGTSNFYIKPELKRGRHTLVAVTYNPNTGAESKSPQVITFEIW